MTAVLFLVPALLLALTLLTLTLLARRYPGERTLVRIAAAPPRSRRRGALARRLQMPHRTVALLARGGALLASPLAVRPPPVAPAPS